LKVNKLKIIDCKICPQCENETNFIYEEGEGEVCECRWCGFRDGYELEIKSNKQDKSKKVWEKLR